MKRFDFLKKLAIIPSVPAAMIVLPKKAPEINNIFKVRDNVLPVLSLSAPCPIQITIREDAVVLAIGPREFKWNKKTGKFIQCGLGSICSIDE